VQLAGELDTTIDVIRRLVAHAGIHRSSSKLRSARQRRRATTSASSSAPPSLASLISRCIWPTA
jgi:hypothetical protein